MEPMALGSPVNPTAQSPSSPATNYLPNFLLGDSNSHSRLGSGTPEYSRYMNSSLNVPSPVSTYSNPELRNSRQRAMFANSHASGNPPISSENHVGGPPTRGLFDTIDVPSVTTTSATTATSPLSTSQLAPSPLISHSFGATSPSSSRANRTHNVTFMDLQSNLSGGSNSNESQGLLQWVTVFGFPMSALNTVISYMSSRVRIVDKHFARFPNSNWIHLKCSVEQEAQRALACNGDIVSGSIMIGVIPCTDEAVVSGSDRENRSRLNGSMRMFPTTSAGNSSAAPYDSSTPKARIPWARPLMANCSHSSPQAVKSPECVPQKSTGIVSKAMEYVFGW